MNFVLVMFLLRRVLWLHAAASQPTFREWCLQYDKTYANEEETLEKQKIYEQNAALVQKLNKNFLQR